MEDQSQFRAVLMINSNWLPCFTLKKMEMNLSTPKVSVSTLTQIGLLGKYLLQLLSSLQVEVTIRKDNCSSCSAVYRRQIISPESRRAK